LTKENLEKNQAEAITFTIPDHRLIEKSLIQNADAEK
jgi:hypothetical protein